MKVLLTGGAGYIGSHTALTLAEAGHHVVLFDNLSNSDKSTVERVTSACGGRIMFELGDIRDEATLSESLSRNQVEAVIHFAARKSVSESFQDPLGYYDTNVAGSISLLRAMERAGIRTIVFSSSANVYGEPLYLPIDEAHPLGANNPYGRTKIVVEGLLASLCESDPRWKAAVLRYFNPVGSHSSGLVGESLSASAGNLMPVVVRVAAGHSESVSIYGSDFETPDGSGVRDYIHVVDLANGHLAALTHIRTASLGLGIWNLGTGNGTSVIELLETFQRANGVKVARKSMDRRAGDVPSCFADATKANRELGWSCHHSLDEMCSSSWAFATQGPR